MMTRSKYNKLMTDSEEASHDSESSDDECGKGVQRLKKLLHDLPSSDHSEDIEHTDNENEEEEIATQSDLDFIVGDNEEDDDPDMYIAQDCQGNQYLAEIDPKIPKSLARYIFIKKILPELSLDEIETFVMKCGKIITLNELKKSKEKDIFRELVKVMKFAYDHEPDAIEILRLNISLEHKTNLIHLYEAYKVLQPSEEKNLLRYKFKLLEEKYRKIYERWEKLSEKDREQISKEEEKLKNMNEEEGIKEKIIFLDADNETRKALYEKFLSLERMRGEDSEYIKLKNQLDLGMSIPYNKCIVLENSSDIITKIANNLDKELYGMTEVKERILLEVNERLANPSGQGCVIGLVGPPGVGKTAICRCLANVLGYPFEQISGAEDAETLKGHCYTYVGSICGEIVRCLCRMKCKNGIILLDEFDKLFMNQDPRSMAAINSVLLEIFDPSQNFKFRDNYIPEIKIDLSRVWWMCSMNEAPPEKSALRDRMTIIHVDGYELKDKMVILRDYVLPKILKIYGMNEGDIIIDEDITRHIILRICEDGDKGIRSVERVIKKIVKKVKFLLDHQEKNIPNISFKLDKILTKPVSITENMVTKFVKSNNRSNPSLAHMYV